MFSSRNIKKSYKFLVFVLLVAAHNNTFVHVDWLMTNDVTSRSVFTLKEAGQFVDFNSETTATTTYAVYINSSAPVLAATLNELQSDVPQPGRTRYYSLACGLHFSVSVL